MKSKVYHFLPPTKGNKGTLSSTERDSGQFIRTNKRLYLNLKKSIECSSFLICISNPSVRAATEVYTIVGIFVELRTAPYAFSSRLRLCTFTCANILLNGLFSQQLCFSLTCGSSLSRIPGPTRTCNLASALDNRHCGPLVDFLRNANLTKIDLFVLEIC